MKKNILTFAIIGIMIIGLTSTSNATTVRCYFYITMNNTCDTTWAGDYCVQLKLTFNGSPITSGVTNCNIVKGGPHCYEFDFTCSGLASDCYYGVEIVAASEVGGGCYKQINTDVGGSWCSSDITTCFEYITVTL